MAGALSGLNEQLASYVTMTPERPGDRAGLGVLAVYAGAAVAATDEFVGPALS